MINDVLDGVTACFDVFNSHRQVQLQKQHVVMMISFEVSMKVEYDLSIRHGNCEGNCIS